MSPSESSSDSAWPALAYADWADSCNTLHLWTQVVGKVKLALAPLSNHWWGIVLFVTARALTTGAMPRQGEPLAFLLGLVRSCGDALFRPRRAAAAGQQDPERRALGDAGSLQPRVLEPRLLARQWRLRPRRLLCLCVSGAGRLRRAAGAAARGGVQQ